MSDQWEPGELRALAAYVLFAEGGWPGTATSASDRDLAQSTIRTVAENTFGDMDGTSPPLTDADVETVVAHLAAAVVMIDGEPYGAEL